MSIPKLLFLIFSGFPLVLGCHSNKAISTTSYRIAPNQGHYYLIPIKDQESLVEVKNALQVFHQQNGYDALGIIKLELEEMGVPILVVRGRFMHLNEILPYEQALTPFLREYQRAILFSAPIALINYQILVLSKDLKGYQWFLANL